MSRRFGSSPKVHFLEKHTCTDSMLRGSIITSRSHISRKPQMYRCGCGSWPWMVAIAAAPHERSLSSWMLRPTGNKTLAECFNIFSLIHQLTTDHGTTARIAREVVEDFAAEGTAYLELRTTPKAGSADTSQLARALKWLAHPGHHACLRCRAAFSGHLLAACKRCDRLHLQARPEHGMTKRSYTEAVLRGIEAASASTGSACQCQLLLRCVWLGWVCAHAGCAAQVAQAEDISAKELAIILVRSIDRREDAAAAMETVELAAELMPRGVIGIDLSGVVVVYMLSSLLSSFLRLPIVSHLGHHDHLRHACPAVRSHDRVKAPLNAVCP